MAILDELPKLAVQIKKVREAKKATTKTNLLARQKEKRDLQRRDRGEDQGPREARKQRRASSLPPPKKAVQEPSQEELGGGRPQRGGLLGNLAAAHDADRQVHP